MRGPVAARWILLLLAGGGALVLLDWPATLTDEDDYMSRALGDLVAGRNPYATAHGGDVLVEYPWGTTWRDHWETTYPYLPALAFLQIPGLDYRWTSLLAYGLLLGALRERPGGFLAFGNPLVMVLAASGFNDFVALALLAWGLRGRGLAYRALAAASKQLVLPLLLLDAALRRDWRPAAFAIGIAALATLPFVLADPAAFWHSAVSQHAAKVPKLGKFLNYWLYPLFAVAVLVPDARRQRAGPADALPTRQGSQDVAIVLPALDEAGSVETVVRGFRSMGVRVVVVDNGSSDGTGPIALAAGAEVVREERRGYGSACLAGLRHLAVDPPGIVVFADCDGTIDPEDLARLVAPIAASDADLTLGRRARRERGALPIHQRLGNTLVLLVLRIAHDVEARDIPPLRAVAWPTLQRMALRETSYGLPVETLVRAAQLRARVVEVDVSYRRRSAGRSKVSGSWRASIAAGATMLRVVLRSAPGGDGS